MRSRSLPSILLFASALTGCDRVSGIESWLGLGEPQPILHASLPQVVTYGGPVLTSPKVVPIFFASDPYQADIERFLSELRGSSYWRATTSEYGVGDLSVEPSMVLSEPAMATTEYTNVEPWLARHLDGSHPEWPAIDPNTIYVVFYPEALLAIDTHTKRTSSAYATYHSEGSVGIGSILDGGSAAAATDAGGQPFVFAIVAEWPESMGFGGIQGITQDTSHELVEATTDPFPTSNPAYNWLDQAHLAWSTILYSDAIGRTYPAGEVADLCQMELGSKNLHLVLPNGFSVDRSWSNRAAEQNQDPCVPAPGDIYFNAAPDLVESVSLRFAPDESYDTNGIRVPLHQTRTVDVRLFATAPRPEWHVSAYEFPSPESGEAAALEFLWDRQTGKDGDILRLTITRNAEGGIGGTQFAVFSSERPDDFELSNWWIGFAAN